MEREIVQGDKGAFVRWLAVILVVVGIVILNEVASHFFSQEEQKLVQSIIALIVTGLFVLVAIMTFLMGVRTLKAGQYPPPGMKVPFRTYRRYGLRAKVYGYFFIFLTLYCLFWLFLFVADYLS
jgi:hypothetical protein